MRQDLSSAGRRGSCQAGLPKFRHPSYPNGLPSLAAPPFSQGLSRREPTQEEEPRKGHEKARAKAAISRAWVTFTWCVVLHDLFLPEIAGSLRREPHPLPMCQCGKTTVDNEKNGQGGTASGVRMMTIATTALKGRPRRRAQWCRDDPWTDRQGDRNETGMTHC